MIELYRYACARCASQAVSFRHKSEKWHCDGCHGHSTTPVVWDLKDERWVDPNRDGVQETPDTRKQVPWSETDVAAEFRFTRTDYSDVSPDV